MNRLPLFLFLIGALLVLIGVSNTRVQIQTSKEVKSTQTVQVSPSAVEAESREQTSQAQVIRVIDGDTINVQIGDKEEKVRLIGINAPETNECFGKEATQRASELLGSKFVDLEADSSQGERDKYKRLLRYVFVQDSSFEEQMIREGFAKEYTYNKPYKYQSLYKSAQIEAQTEKRGLWADNACSSSAVEQSPRPSSSVQGSYNCDCSKLCSQISTCDEAYYQLNTCGCSKRDSDHDGIPCESLCK